MFWIADQLVSVSLEKWPYMEDFQLRAKSDDYPELNNWPWYVDDSVLKCKRNRSQAILNHLNSIEPDDIKFTMEEEEKNKLASLDLQLNVNRKTKKIEFNVHYKKTNTNITIKKQSNHKANIKSGIIKGYSDRAKALCDPQYLEDELKNIEEVFVENGYSKREIQQAMKDREPTDKGEEEKRGIVVMPNIPGFTPQFNRIARRHKFKVANKTESRVKDLISNAKTPLGDKNSQITYVIPCKCEESGYNGETDRMWESRKKEHQDKIRLTLQDAAAGNIDKVAERTNTNDGGLAKHVLTTGHEVDWENARIVGRERGWTQRKYLEGIESLRQKNNGVTPLNTYNQLEQWQSTLYTLFKNN